MSHPLQGARPTSMSQSQLCGSLMGEGITLSNLHSTVGELRSGGRHWQRVGFERGQNPNRAPSIPHRPATSLRTGGHWPGARPGLMQGEEASRLAWGAAGAVSPNVCEWRKPRPLPDPHQNDFTSHSAHQSGLQHLLQEALRPPHPGQASTVPAPMAGREPSAPSPPWSVSPGTLGGAWPVSTGLGQVYAGPAGLDLRRQVSPSPAPASQPVPPPAHCGVRRPKPPPPAI